MIEKKDKIFRGNSSLESPSPEPPLVDCDGKIRTIDVRITHNRTLFLPSKSPQSLSSERVIYCETVREHARTFAITVLWGH